MPLSDAKLRTLKPGAKARKISDADGLHILITPGGSRLWRFAYRFAGRQKQLALGAYPLVSLAEARRARDDAKRLLIAGTDPSEVRKAEELRKRLLSEDSFRAVADEWFRRKQRRWAASYSSRLRSRLEADLFPKLGPRPIAEIEPLEVLDVVRRVERRDAVEMAKRIMQMASAIFRYGVATGRCPRDPTADLRGALQEAAPPKHRSALAAAELPEFLARLEAYDGEETTRLALELVVLTFVRSAELRFARWEEFEDLDGEAPLWRIPAERMKMRRPHLVPLAPRAVEVLAALKARSGRSPFIVPAATRTGVISENTMIYALYRMGYHGRATVHGFRSTASTILNEHQFNRDWIESQLARCEGSVRAIYNAAQWLPGRREMMIWWAQYLASARALAEPLSAAAVTPWVRVGRPMEWVREGDALAAPRRRGRPPKIAADRSAKRPGARRA
jgi:integrase